MFLDVISEEKKTVILLLFCCYCLAPTISQTYCCSFSFHRGILEFCTSILHILWISHEFIYIWKKYAFAFELLYGLLEVWKFQNHFFWKLHSPKSKQNFWRISIAFWARGHLYITQGCFEASLNHPPTYVRTFLLHKVRERT